MFCKNCGAEIADNATFCPKCGSQANQASNQGNPYQGQPNQPYGGQPYGYQGGGYRPPSSNSGGGAKIMLIIGGILVIIYGILMLKDTFQAMPYMGLIGGGYAFAVILQLIYSIIMIVMGIMAIVYNGRTDKANTLYMLGIVCIIFRILLWIITAAMLSGIPVSIVGVGDVILGLIAPILIVAGGYMNKKTA